MGDILKPPLLFLCHRIPVPPNKGDKIRSFNILKYLSKDYSVYLATFIDDEYDKRYVHMLDEYCEESFVVSRPKLLSLAKGLKGFIFDTAISLPFYSSSKMKNWVNSIVEQRDISKIFIFSSVMAQFAEPHMVEGNKVFMDFVDADSDKWKQYSAEKKGLAKWFYKRESQKLEEYEVKVAQMASFSSFVSVEETSFFTQLLSTKYKSDDAILSRIETMQNGVDTDYFDPSLSFTNPYIDNKIVITFTGAMDYLPNIEAVVWFVEKIWPQLYSKNKDLVFCIVGSNPSEAVRELANESIFVTGRVEDVRPYIVYCELVVAPIQIARGVQNKVLEALAMAKPIVLTQLAAQGINERGHHNYIIANDADAFATAVLQLLEDNSGYCETNRKFVLENFSWNSSLHNSLAKLRD